MTHDLRFGDCLDVLRTLPDCSVDAVVTDPPYGLAFMGKRWDYDVPSEDGWRECLRVLKPGGHLLAFAGTRTQHRMACRIEDAGFEIRDMIAWVYGSGFPKSLDVSKAIDKAAGAEREVVGSKLGQPGYSLSEHKGREVYAGDWSDPAAECAITAPATPEAQQWAGWGTALKPALEPIARRHRGRERADAWDGRTEHRRVSGCDRRQARRRRGKSRHICEVHE
jgi:site-specific DNA-methyltransferase (adenine-specific)